MVFFSVSRCKILLLPKSFLPLSLSFILVFAMVLVLVCRQKTFKLWPKSLLANDGGWKDQSWGSFCQLCPMYFLPRPRLMRCRRTRRWSPMTRASSTRRSTSRWCVPPKPWRPGSDKMISRHHQHYAQQKHQQEEQKHLDLTINLTPRCPESPRLLGCHLPLD